MRDGVDQVTARSGSVPNVSEAIPKSACEAEWKREASNAG